MSSTLSFISFNVLCRVMITCILDLCWWYFGSFHAAICYFFNRALEGSFSNDMPSDFNFRICNHVPYFGHYGVCTYVQPEMQLSLAKPHLSLIANDVSFNLPLIALHMQLLRHSLWEESRSRFLLDRWTWNRQTTFSFWPTSYAIYFNSWYVHTEINRSSPFLL